MKKQKLKNSQLRKVMSFLGKRSLKTMTKKQRIDRARKAGKSKKPKLGLQLF